MVRTLRKVEQGSEKSYDFWMKKSRQHRKKIDRCKGQYWKQDVPPILDRTIVREYSLGSKGKPEGKGRRILDLSHGRGRGVVGGVAKGAKNLGRKRGSVQGHSTLLGAPSLLLDDPVKTERWPSGVKDAQFCGRLSSTKKNRSDG